MIDLKQFFLLFLLIRSEPAARLPVPVAQSTTVNGAPKRGAKKKV